MDTYTQLTAMGDRWYDAQLGRWISADSIVPGFANPQSLNRFTYVRNNPLRYADPSGHTEIEPYRKFIEQMAAKYGIPTIILAAMLHSQGQKWERNNGVEYALLVEESCVKTNVIARVANYAVKVVKGKSPGFSYPHSYGMGQIRVSEIGMYGDVPSSSSWSPFVHGFIFGFHLPYGCAFAPTRLALDNKWNIELSAQKIASVDTAIKNSGQEVSEFDRFIMYSVAQNNMGGAGIVDLYFSLNRDWTLIFDADNWAWEQSSAMLDAIRELYELGYDTTWLLPEGVTLEEWENLLNNTNPN